MGEGTTVSTSLGLFAVILGNMSIVTYGVAAQRTVASQCRSGSSPGGLFYFDGSLDPSDRYDGMKLAFGGDAEILKPNREGGCTHEPLDAATYKKLLFNVEKRRSARLRDLQHVNHSLWYHKWGPIYGWSTTQKFYPLYWLYGAFAFGPLTILLLVRIGTRQSLVQDLMYIIFYLGVKLYCWKVLEIRRHVRYIKVAEAQLPRRARIRWQGEWGLAHHDPPLNGQEAVSDIKRGSTRQLVKDGTKYLLLPVMSLEATLGDDAAQWWFIFRRLRGPLLTCSYFFPGSNDHNYAVAFAICAFIQACLQDDAMRVFLTNTNTYNVNWFRRDRDDVYPEVHEPYYRTLG